MKEWPVYLSISWYDMWNSWCQLIIKVSISRKVTRWNLFQIKGKKCIIKIFRSARAYPGAKPRRIKFITKKREEWLIRLNFEQWEKNSSSIPHFDGTIKSSSYCMKFNTLKIPITRVQKFQYVSLYLSTRWAERGRQFLIFAVYSRHRATAWNFGISWYRLLQWEYFVLPCGILVWDG